MTEVKIEEAELVLTGGYIPWLKEKYPFSKLTNATFTDANKTIVKGPSFVIVKDDNPVSTLAAGRKRFKHCTYISRKISKEGDVRVWLHPDSPLPGDKAVKSAAQTEPAKAKASTKLKIVSKSKQPPAEAKTPKLEAEQPKS